MDLKLVKNDEDAEKVDIIDKEFKEEGGVPLKLWFRFYNFGCGIFGILFLIVVALLSIFFNIIPSYLIGVWTEKNKEDQADPIYFHLYWISAVAYCIFTFLRCSSVYYTSLHSSVNIHKKALWKLLRAPCVFFDANPIGRILTRFSKDTVLLDYFFGCIMNIVVLGLAKTI